MRRYVASAIPLLSASQIGLFGECKRKWAWRYIAKLQTPRHPAAALGTEVDDTQLQPYLRDGRPFDYTRESGYIAAAGLAYLPRPKTPGMEVQRHFILPSPASKGEFAYQGYMDLWLPDSALVPDMPGGAPFVGDFKTTSDLKWAKSEEALKHDVQAMLYATDALYETKAKAVDLSWMYFQTRGAKKTKRTCVRVSTEHVVEQFEAIEKTALLMHEARQTVDDPLALPPSPSQCEAYGGCPFRSRCNLSPVDHIASLAAHAALVAHTGVAHLNNPSSGTVSLLASLKARKAEAAPAPSPAPAQAPAPAPVPAAPLGINPPEASLPPPPAKRGPGRPKKEAATPAPAAEVLPGQLALPLEPVVIPGPAPAAAIDYDKLAILIVDQFCTRMARSRGAE